MPHVSYFWDEIEDNVVEEFDGDTGATIASYTTEPSLYGSVLSQDRGGEKRTFQFDGRGNTSELTNESENVTDTRRYTAFGSLTEDVGTTVVSYAFGARQGYRRARADDLAYVRARTLSVSRARWLSVDPSQHYVLETKYGLLRNNPSAYADPSGELCFQDVVVPRKNLPCSDDVWHWSIEWNPAPHQSGYILQRISVSMSVLSCDRQTYQWSTGECPLTLAYDSSVDLIPSKILPETRQSEYWELWLVHKGKVYGDKALMKSQGDEFLLEGFNNKRGYYSVEALAFFMPTPGVVPSAPPPGGWNNWSTDVDHMSKGLPFTCAKCPPAFALPAPASLVRRTFSAYFCCCPDKPTISVHANAVSGRCK